MPIQFAENWNKLHLSKLKLAPVDAGKDPAAGLGNIARFWKAKTRLKADAPARIAALDEQIDPLENLEGGHAVHASVPFTRQQQAQLAELRAQRERIRTAIRRDKVTAPMVKTFSPELAPGLHGGTPKLLDPVMEQIHNDRLRIADRDMLKRYYRLSIINAMVSAKPRFTQDAKVAAMFARAIAVDGEPVMITQGVHQEDDPHFDVLAPGETQQYHIDVTLGKPLVVRSVSYMLGPQKKDGVRRVGADGEPVVDVL